MQKIDFINNQQPALNATNLNKMQDNVEDELDITNSNITSLSTNKLDKTSVKDTYSTSETDTYCCNYVNGLETYSTSETRVGTWIDGRPIYRKTFTIPSFSINEISVNTGLTTISNIVNWKGCFKRTDINCLYSIDNALMDEWRFNYNTGIMIFKTNNQYVNFTGYITLEYTKTNN